MKIFDHVPGRRARATPDSPPRITAITVAPNAARKELRMASPMLTKSKTSRNQSVMSPLTTNATAKPIGPNQFSRRFGSPPRAAMRRLAATKTPTITMNRSAREKVEPPSNNSPHHLLLGLPVQMVNETPPLNECRTTRPIGMNMNTRTRTVQMLMAIRTGSTRLARTGSDPSLATAAAERSWRAARSRWATGSSRRMARGMTT